MRPLSLTFEGLRSYRAKTVIDFSNLDLFAVIGDTGAGKSTIIEALTLALYARKSWSGGGSNLVDMIADGVNTMRIELTFHADGHDWVVTRARHRNSSQPVDKLVSPTGGGSVDQARQVTAKIEELIGLSHEQFTRAVVLPQGRFDELLRANDKDRSALLASILGLDAITKTRDALDVLRSEYKTHAATFIERRRRYPDDPPAELANRTAAAFELSQRFEALIAALEVADVAQREASMIGEVAVGLTRTLAAVPPIPDGTSPAELDAFVTLAGMFASRAADASAAVVDLDRQLADVETEMDQVLQGYASRDDLVARRVELVQVDETLTRHIGAYHDAVAQHTAVIAAVPPDGIDPALVAEHREIDARHVEALAEVRVARERHDAARTVWRDLVGAFRRFAERGIEVGPLETVVARCDDEVAEARAALIAAEALSERAAAAHQAAVIADAAATAGAQCRPGEPCPVCVRPLPDTYVAPVPADHHLELSLRDEAKAAVAACRARLDRAVAAAGEARGAFQQAVAACDAARELFEASAAAAGELELPIPVGYGDGDGWRAEVPEEAVALAGSAAVLDAATRRSDVLAEAVAVMTAKVAAATASVEARRVAYATELAAAEQTLRTARTTLVGIHRIVGSEPSGDPAVNTSGSGDGFVVPDRSLVSELVADCTRRLGELDRLATARVELDGDRAAARQRVADARDDYTAQVRDPLRAVVEAVNVRSGRIRDVVAVSRTAVGSLPGLVDVLDESVLALAADDVTFPVKADGVAAAAEAITRTTEHAAIILEAAVTARDACEEGSLAATARVHEAVTGASCTDVNELRVASGRIAGELAQARQAVADAQSAVSAAAGLDRVVTIAEPFVANLEVLVASLRDQHFVTHLVKAREAELLAEASRRLKAITNGKFGFVAGFGVVNITSGERRTPDTLSGGERFQAALGLALALVEIASRGAGRLDAVFVDEGFGSLDANALDVALETLGKVSGAGKMVALISHLRPVAEYVDTVLHVTKDDLLGSRITVLNAEAREQLLADDIRSGLTR